MSTSTLTPAPFTGTYTVDPVHSSFGFAVRHMGVSTFRGSFTDVAATVTAPPDGIVALTGEARAESISIVAPPEMRAHLLSEDFFDAERHPTLTYASERVELRDDGTLVVDGTLTIRNVSRQVTATGTWQAPVDDPFGATRAGIELTARIDRRDFGMAWNAPLPRGGDALGTAVDLTIHLELLQG
jgi:polyisoprenoid-binding protein YceI